MMSTITFECIILSKDFPVYHARSHDFGINSIRPFPSFEVIPDK